MGEKIKPSNFNVDCTCFMLNYCVYQKIIEDHNNVVDGNSYGRY